MGHRAPWGDRVQAGGQAGGEPQASPAHQVCLGRAGEGAAQPGGSSSIQVTGMDYERELMVRDWVRAVRRPGQRDGKDNSEDSRTGI